MSERTITTDDFTTANKDRKRKWTRTTINRLFFVAMAILLVAIVVLIVWYVQLSKNTMANQRLLQQRKQVLQNMVY